MQLECEQLQNWYAPNAHKTTLLKQLGINPTCVLQNPDKVCTYNGFLVDEELPSGCPNQNNLKPNKKAGATRPGSLESRMETR